MKTVLLIDDDPLEQRLLTAFLSMRFGDDFDLHHVSDVKSGLDILRDTPVDVVFLDNRLPTDGDFQDTAPRIQEAAPEALLILISASADDDRLDAAADAGITQVVSKFDLGAEIASGLLG